MRETQFSVLMSIYRNTNLQEFIDCLDSLENQTVKASEYVVVIDGEIAGELHDFVFNNAYNLKLVPLKENVGLGRALQFGLEECSHELVARMDTDDICVPTRFEKQLAEFEKNDKLCIVGSNIAEFIDTKENIVSYRNVPNTHEEICEYLKSRCPLNHMTVMFKKSEVLKAGGYLHWHYNEDSYLWIRMFLAGCIFYNINEVLVYARINEQTFQRRGGYKYFVSEKNLFKFMKDNKIINNFSYLKNIFIRFIIQVLMPNKLRKIIFLKLMREKKV